MKLALMTIAAIALIGTIVPSVLYLAGTLSKDTMQWLMLVATIVWFAAVPFCGRSAKPAEARQPADAD
ncbi:MAG: hypothetical protein JXO22_12750 [Phycisphaerae bacterium]|nr:hypothetical protein [Phycisphaerae bacterium]